MQVSTASSPGRDGRANEDFVGSVPGAVVLLDGAGVPRMEEVCRHGVGWYVETLGTRLLRLLVADPSALLTETLARALQEVADRHRDACDLEDPRGPMATVAIARVRDQAVDLLVLADAFVVVEPLVGPPQVITDPREVNVRSECLALLVGIAEGTPEHAERLAQVVAAFRSRRNTPGGYWIAKDDARAAAHAVTSSREVGALRSVCLLSNGASRLVEPYQVMSWPKLVQELRTGGPDALLQRLRNAERQLEQFGDVAPARDDATIAYCELGRSDAHELGNRH